MIFLGMAFWYKETSSSFIEGQNNVCSTGDIFNATAGPLTLGESTVGEDSNSQLQNALKTFVKLIYLEEILHFSISEVFNIF